MFKESSQPFTSDYAFSTSEPLTSKPSSTLASFAPFLILERLPPNPPPPWVQKGTTCFPLKTRPYIYDSRTKIERAPLNEHSTHSNKVTDIGSLLSLEVSHMLCLLQIRFYPRFLILKSLSASLFASFFAISCRLSYSFLPRASPISTFTRLPLK